MSRSEDFVLVAHRGNNADAPENTIASFDSALDSGFPHFETDCQLTADDAVVILHDEQLGRTTPGAQGAVAQTAWSDLRGLDAGGWFAPDFAGARIPLLSDLLQRYRGRAHIHLELKSKQPELPGHAARELIEAGWGAGSGHQKTSSTAPPHAPPAPPPGSEATETFGTDELKSYPQPLGQVEQPAVAVAAVVAGTSEAAAPVLPDSNPGQQCHHAHFAVPGLTITSFHLEQLRRSLQVLPGVTHGWLVHELTDLVIQEALASGCRQVCPRANVLSATAVRQATAAGLSVRAWGIKDMQLLHHVVGCGCHGATVNWPRQARQELQRPPPQAPSEEQAGALGPA